MKETFETADYVGLSGKKPDLQIGHELELHFFIGEDIRHFTIDKRIAIDLLRKLAHWVAEPGVNL